MGDIISKGKGGSQLAFLDDQKALKLENVKLDCVDL